MRQTLEQSGEAGQNNTEMNDSSSTSKRTKQKHQNYLGAQRTKKHCATQNCMGCFVWCAKHVVPLSCRLAYRKITKKEPVGWLLAFGTGANDSCALQLREGSRQRKLLLRRHLRQITNDGVVAATELSENTICMYFDEKLSIYCTALCYADNLLIAFPKTAWKIEINGFSIIFPVNKPQ